MDVLFSDLFQNGAVNDVATNLKTVICGEADTEQVVYAVYACKYLQPRK